MKLLEHRLEWMRRLGAAAEVGAASRAARHPVVRARLQSLRRLHTFALQSVERMLRQLRRAERSRP